MKYNASLKPALENLSLNIEPGMKVAVVGRTGAGKSSLYQLLIGFRSANEGKVMIDGVDVSKLDLKSLRSSVNVVLQQPFILTSDSIRLNLDPLSQFTDQ